jgi:hypothetical protein
VQPAACRDGLCTVRVDQAPRCCASRDAVVHAPSSPHTVYTSPHMPPYRAAPRRCSIHTYHHAPCSAGGTFRTALLQFQCVCAVRAAPHLPFAAAPRVSPPAKPARCAPTSHQCACRSSHRYNAAPGTASPSALPHPHALHTTPLVSVIAPHCGECRAVLSLPFLRWRHTSGALLHHRNVAALADGNRESSRSPVPLGAAAFVSTSGWHSFALRTHQQ